MLGEIAGGLGVALGARCASSTPTSSTPGALSGKGGAGCSTCFYELAWCGGGRGWRESEAVAVKLNDASFEFAKRLVTDGKAVLDERDEWSEHQPSAREQNRFIEEHGFEEYERWHLGVDDEHGRDSKARYKFPYGDFERVHRCGILAAESRAAQRKYHDIELATAHLHGMLDALR
jgi:hypothetical protein